MSLNLQTYQPNSAGKAKHLFLANENPCTPCVEYVPRFYVEARIDFADVRSKLREIFCLSSAAELCAVDSDSLWTSDLVWAVDPEKVKPTIPDGAHLRNLPEFVDAHFLSRMETRFLEYLSRYFQARVFRNFALNIYSASGESLNEFTCRCLELLGDPFRRDLDILHEVFDRMLKQIKEKYSIGDSKELELSEMASRLKSILHQMSERIAEIFLRTELNLNSVGEVSRPLRLRQPELEERLASLELEARVAIGRLLSAYQEKVRNIDEYIIHPNLKDIHLVRSCILWMPIQAR